MIDTIPQASPGSTIEERRAEYDTAIATVLDSGRYILSAQVEAFEDEFATYLGSRHAIGVANGTDAIELALRALGVGLGDAVFTVSLTAVATIAAILRLGATPVLVDVDDEMRTMDPSSLRDAIRSVRAPLVPRAVVPVHLHGAMADMPTILEIARSAGLLVVEDCAQAHGSSLDGRLASSWGDAAAFSFYPTKNLGAVGDGGAVVTSDDAVAERVRELRQYGWRDRQLGDRIGVNSRLDELQAAVLRVGLRHLDFDNDRRIATADRYDAGLAGTRLALPARRPTGRPVFHQYVVRTTARDDLRDWCSSKGVSTAIHYPVPVHLQDGYKDVVVRGSDLNITERICTEIASLPMFPQLTSAQVARVIDVASSWPAS